jgi:LL-diaminopimelate aminotransferase
MTVAPRCLIEFAALDRRGDAVPRINEHYLSLNASYLFAEIKRRTEAFRRAHPDARIISLGIGDVTRPLPAVVVAALEAAVREQARAETLRGYGPYVGYEWLRAEIAAHDFGARGITLGVDEIFVSDGGKSDGANIQEIFADDCVVALMDPVYPVYADSNVMAGRGARPTSTGATRDSCTCRARPRTAFSRRSPIATSTSSISVIRITRPAR